VSDELWEIFEPLLLPSCETKSGQTLQASSRFVREEDWSRSRPSIPRATRPRGSNRKVMVLKAEAHLMSPGISPCLFTGVRGR
jgi:hypothetical protein